MPSILAFAFWPSLLIASGSAAVMPPSPERRALDYLAHEVPKWSVENKCYSCHNNGDAARALFTAVRMGETIPEKALADTTAWLTKPDRWDHNGGEGPYSDKKLALLQFAAALADAVDAGLVKDREPLESAAVRVAAGQEQDGSWPVDAAASIGSPATHGASLATYLARRTLSRADSKRFHHSITKADEWLRHAAVKSELDAGAILRALAKDTTGDAVKQRRRCLELIRKGEAPDGGWGPYVATPPEAFDTAIVLLGLVEQTDRTEIEPMIQRGRTFLLRLQKEDGSWPETTRPSGAVSYAQRLSTTGWATVALLATLETKRSGR
jgi:hypothetical protein